MDAVLERPHCGSASPAWLRTGVPLTLLLDVACLAEPHYAEILGQALAREGAGITGAEAFVSAPSSHPDA